jgi:hypothetical protein
MRKIVYMFSQDQAPHWFAGAMPQDYPWGYWDPDQQYSTDTVFYYDMYGPHHDTILTHLDRGHKIIFDAKNEHYIHDFRRWVLEAFQAHPGQGCFVISGDQAQNISGVSIVATPYWYWITDQSNLRIFKLDQYQPQPRRTKKFFMSIGLQRHDRDYLYDSLGPLLEDSIHSYRARGVILPNDWCEEMGGPWQRYINPDWLDSTAFTLAVETYIDDDTTSGYSLTHRDNLFLCEKSYKPLACQHPILMVSTKGNLSYLRSQGFETFPELWDESYDDIADWRERIDCVVEIVRNFNVDMLDNPVIKEKLLYNSARFFDKDLTKKLLNSSIIEPVLEFANE